MPENPITIRTMAPKGATQDQLLVHLQGILRARFATDLAIVNSPGRDGIDAAALAARDPLDGRHFLMTSAYSINYYPAYSDVGYRREDFEPVAAIGAYKFVHVTAAANPWRDLGEALAAVRGEGRALRFAGVGEVDLLMMKAMARRAGVAVEFKQTGGPALLASVLAREVDVGVGTHHALLQEGKVRVLAQLHARAERGPGAAPTPRDFGCDARELRVAVVAAGIGAGGAGAEHRNAARRAPRSERRQAHRRAAAHGARASARCRAGGRARGPARGLPQAMGRCRVNGSCPPRRARLEKAGRENEGNAR